MSVTPTKRKLDVTLGEVLPQSKVRKSDGEFTNSIRMLSSLTKFPSYDQKKLLKVLSHEEPEVQGFGESIEEKEGKIFKFPKEGVQLKFLRTFVEEYGGEEYFHNLTTTDVCERIIKPRTLTFQSSYCDLLANEMSSYVGPAHVFISHAWKYYFLDVVHALEDHFSDNKEIILWFDLFSNNQHAATSLEFSWWCTTFRSAIQQFGHTVLILSPWDDPIPLTRAWCLFEIYCSVDAESQFEIAMCKSEQKRFIESIESEPDSIQRMIAVVDVERSEASNPLDKQLIFEAITKTVGFNKINTIIFELLRHWTVKTVQRALREEKDNVKQIQLHAMLGYLYRILGKIDQSLTEYLICLEKQKEIYGENSLVVMKTEGSIGDLYQRKGNHKLAYESLSDCVNKSIMLLGEENEETLFFMHGLGNVSSRLGNYQEAEKIFRKLYEIRCQTIGNKHAYTLASMNNLAESLQRQDQLIESEKLYLECLQLRQLSLGLSHPDTLNSMNNLANLYQRLSRYKDAQPLYEECLKLRSIKLGYNHASTLSSMNNLGYFYSSTKQYTLAIDIYINCLEKRKEKLGINHPETISTMNNLGFVYLKLYKLNSSESLLEYAYQLRQMNLGNEHPDTIWSLNTLTELYYKQKKYLLAKEIGEKCLSIRQKKFGMTHYDTLYTMQMLADVYKIINNDDEGNDSSNSNNFRNQAEELLKQVFDIRMTKHGNNNHPDALWVMQSYAEAMVINKKYEEAKEKYEYTLKEYKEKGKDYDVEVITVLNGLANLYEKQSKDFQRSEKYYEEALVLCDRVSKELPIVWITYREVGRFYQRFGWPEKAIQWMKQCLSIIEITLGREDPTTLEVEGELSKINSNI